MRLLEREKIVDKSVKQFYLDYNKNLRASAEKIDSQVLYNQ